MHCVFSCVCVDCMCMIVCDELYKDSIYMVYCVGKTRVEKYNLRGSKR